MSKKRRKLVGPQSLISKYVTKLKLVQTQHSTGTKPQRLIRGTESKLKYSTGSQTIEFPQSFQQHIMRKVSLFKSNYIHKQKNRTGPLFQPHAEINPSRP